MKDRPELPGQTALRGVAALVVFIAHVAYFRLFAHAELFQSFYHIFYWHNEAVDLFFELSGFILFYVYTQRNFGWRDYFIARFARIYPVYFVSTLVFLALLYYDFKLGRGWHNFDLRAVITNILLLQNWPFVDQPILNFPTWSISVEVFLYIIIFPSLMLLNKYLGFWAKLGFVVLPIIVEAVVIYQTWGLNSDGQDVIWPPFDIWRGIICFTSGFFTCSLGFARGFPAVIPQGIEVVLLVVAASCLMLQFPFNRKVAVVFFPLLAYLSAQDTSVLTRLFKGAGFVWLGHLSYSIYIWHWAVFRLSTMSLTRMYKFTHIAFFDSPLLLLLVSAFLVLGIAHCSHFYLERPANRWLRKKLSRAADPMPVAMS